MEKLHEKILYFQDGKSDKVYKVWIECSVGTGLGLYHVKAAYGRRGGTLTGTNKETSTLRENALYHLNKLIADKKAKGYKENLTEAYSPLNETAATPNQVKLLKSFVPVIPPGLTKNQAQFMIDQYQKEKTYKSKVKTIKTWTTMLPSNSYPSPGKPGSMQPATTMPSKPATAPVPKNDPPVVAGPTGRRIKEID